MNEAIRELFLTDWVHNATTDEIVEKLIQNDERGKEIEKLNNIIYEIEAIIYNEQLTGIEARIEIQERIDKLNELKEKK